MTDPAQSSELDKLRKDIVRAIGYFEHTEIKGNFIDMEVSVETKIERVEALINQKILEELYRIKSSFVRTGWAGTHNVYQTSFDIDERINQLKGGR